MKKLKCVLILILFISVFLCKSVFASFADFTEEDAKKQTQKMIEEHNKEFDSTKSNNNYLKELKISGGELSPNFERQTLEYTFKLENKTNQIEITATPEDEHAKINGTGKIDILNISECKIDVIAASGTTRTYLVKIIKQDEETTEQKSTAENIANKDEELKNETINSKIVNEDESKNKEASEKKELKKYLLIGAGVILLIIVFLMIIKRKNKKAKH